MTLVQVIGSPVRAQSDETQPDVEEETVPQEDEIGFEEDSPYVTEVHGHRLQRTDQVTGFAETIEVADKARSHQSVAEVISAAVGVQVRRLGGLDGGGTLSIRGSQANQVPVYLDGVLLNTAGVSAVDLGDLSLDTLESIEIYRGTTPAFLGPGGIGGALVLNSREITTPTTEVALSYGSWNTGRLLLLRTDRIDRIGMLAILTVRGSRGDFRYLNRNGTLFETDDDRIARRQNNQHLSYGSLVKLDRAIGRWHFTLADDLLARDQGVAGIDSVPTANAELTSLRNAISLRATSQGWSRTKVDWELGHLFFREDFDDSQNEIGLGFQRAVSRANTVAGRTHLALELTEHHTSHLRLGGQFEHLAQKELTSGSEPDPKSRAIGNCGLEHDWHPWPVLNLVAGIDLEAHQAWFGGGPVPGTALELPARNRRSFFWSPAAGARWEALPGLTVRANGGRYLRSPDLAELFGGQGSTVGNPELDPEIGFNWDLGLTYLYLGRGPVSFLRADGAWFGSLARDLIVYVQNSQNTIRPENVSSARTNGLELGLRLTFFDLLSAMGNYTYLQAINTSNLPFHRGKRLPGRPVHEAYGRLEAGDTDGKWGQTVWLEADYAGQNYLDQAGLKEDALARLLFGLGFRLSRPQEGLSLTLEVKNIFDTIAIRDKDGRQRPLRDFEGFPLPGRTLLLTLHLELDHRQEDKR